MGNSRWDPKDWTTRLAASSYTTRSADDIFSKKVDDTMVASSITFREARDSVHNPESTPIILALDSTGSMSSVIKTVISKFGVVIQEIIDRKPVPDPAIMTMLFDDVFYVTGKQGVLQVSQFESDDKAVDQMEKMHITGQGGGNNSESYHLPLYMAAFKTRTDCFEKRGEKGYLFVVGDEECPPALTVSQIKSVFGPDESASEDMTYDDLFAAASRMYHVFHVVIMQGSHAYGQGEKKMRESWSKHVGEHLIIVNDVESIPEIVVSAIQAHQGADVDSVSKSWSGTTAVAVKDAITGIAKKGSGGKGVVTL